VTTHQTKVKLTLCDSLLGGVKPTSRDSHR